MAKRKKKGPSGPRRKRLWRPARLMAAKAWLPTYGGGNIVRGYCRWFGVDLPCAIAELKMLNAKLDPDYTEQALASHAASIAQRQKARQQKAEDLRRIAEDWPNEFVADFASAAW